MNTNSGSGTVVSPGSKDLILEGDLVIKDREGKVRIRLDRETGNMFVNDARGNPIFLWEAGANNLRIGGNGRDGDLVIFPGRAVNISNTSEATFHFNADQASLALGGNASDGKLVCKDKSGSQNIFLDGASGTIRVGANQQDGDLIVHDRNNTPTIHLSGTKVIPGIPGSIPGLPVNIPPPPSIFAMVRVGAKGSSGAVHLFAANANNAEDPQQAAIRMEAATSSLVLGGGEELPPGRLSIFGGEAASALTWSSEEGSLRLFPTSKGVPSSPEKATISLSAASANFRAGGHGLDGDILLYPKAADNLGDDTQSSIHLSADTGAIRAGGGKHQVSGNILIHDKNNKATIHLDGEAGDIILENADCAEDFEIATNVEASTGSVMVIDAEGKLRLGDSPYDRRVAGIIAGAGELKPGIILGRKRSLTGGIRVPIALTGRVYGKVDASEAAIQVGDLLTTSPKAGFAMKATDPGKAFGAVVGKALASLDRGTGMIPILVALQ